MIIILQFAESARVINTSFRRGSTCVYENMIRMLVYTEVYLQERPRHRITPQPRRQERSFNGSLMKLASRHSP